MAVLCTVGDKDAVLAEAARVLHPAGRLRLLVYVRTTDDLSGGPDGNTFPSEDELIDLVTRAGFHITDRCLIADLPADSEDWARRAKAVDNLLSRRHADHTAWQNAENQARAFGELLGDGRVRGMLLALRKRHPQPS